MLCKIRRQYLLTCKVDIHVYCVLASLHGSRVVISDNYLLQILSFKQLSLLWQLVACADPHIAFLANTRWQTNAGTKLAKRRRRWANVVPALAHRLVPTALFMWQLSSNTGSDIAFNFSSAFFGRRSYDGWGANQRPGSPQYGVRIELYAARNYIVNDFKLFVIEHLFIFHRVNAPGMTTFIPQQFNLSYFTRHLGTKPLFGVLIWMKIIQRNYSIITNRPFRYFIWYVI